MPGGTRADCLVLFTWIGMGPGIAFKAASVEKKGGVCTRSCQEHTEIEQPYTDINRRLKRELAHEMKQEEQKEREKAQREKKKHHRVPIFCGPWFSTNKQDHEHYAKNWMNVVLAFPHAIGSADQGSTTGVTVTCYAYTDSDRPRFHIFVGSGTERFEFNLTYDKLRFSRKK